ncbi:TD and POZ domain-containing protein 1-like [Apodemus sylvaticus]|uniref:TD and POZ domain-containing protein 1-like n=1 Tax=Apodemus sylvaticus TaxID=10129 RepID=UPI00224414BF|nr:TD and POZ domain-containing protein 1-like [Apodemus sylvaticus]
MSGDMEAKSWGSTQISVKNICCEWTISNFSFCMDGIQKEIRSPEFSLEANEEAAWCLRVYPNGVDKESKDYLSVDLGLLSCPVCPVWAKFEFWIINSQGEKCQSRKNPSVASFWQDQHRGFKEFILRDFLLSHQHLLLPEDQLTICCKVSIAGAIFSMPGQNMTPAIKDPRHVLADDLGKLWENSIFTDCSLFVGGHEFRAHKAILAARSPVFRAMFEHEMQERLKNLVEIHDLDPQVFQEMMGFIYTWKAPNLKSYSMASGVLAAADRYGLEGLKAMCEDALCRILSVENAANILILADLHSTQWLKTQALDFITDFAYEVSKTSGWKSLVESHPPLVAEAFCSLASAQCPSLEP